MVAVVISLVLYCASPGWVVGLGRVGGTKVMISLYTLSRGGIRVISRGKSIIPVRSPLHPSTSRFRSSNDESYECSQIGYGGK